MKRINYGFLPILLTLLSFNFAWAQAPAGFYKTAEGKNQKELLIALNKIVGPHTVVSYDGLWNVYKTSDVLDGYVWDMYSTTKFTPGKKQCGNYSQVGDCYNREHSFPKSWFDDAKPMYSDAYHLYPTDGKVNGQRSNHPYGECANGTTLPPNGNNKALGKLGACTFPGYRGTVFEPIDEYKGDFARSYFYMASAYQDKIRNWHSDMLANNDYPCFSAWAIDLLLKWSRQDPVSKKEIDRNEVVYSYQRNRNPYIDHPELAEYVWGNKKDQQWVPGGVPTPTISVPTGSQRFDMGVTSLNKSINYTIDVKGSALSKDLNITVSDKEHFALQSSTLSFNDVNNGTAKIVVTYTSATSGTNMAYLTISSSEATVSVTVEATAYDGIPALPATNVTMTEFTANWLDVTGSGNYSLSVFNSDGVTLHEGFPVSVPAIAASYDVTGLEHSSDYYYTLSNGTINSNKVKVTTAAPIPMLTMIYPESGLNFSTLPGMASDPVEVEVYTEYITEQITATITGEFEASLDKTNWSSTLTLNPQGENFYIRSKANSVEGTYTGSVELTTPSFTGEDADLKVVVASPRTFFEDFEATTVPNPYYNGDFVGSACKWTAFDAGKGDTSQDRKNGKQSIRYGKSETSSLSMAEDKPNGAGTLSFYAALFGTDIAANLKISYSTDGGANWTYVIDVPVVETILKEHSIPLNINAPVRIKFEQTSGKRLNLDDVSISDFSSVTSVSKDNWDAYAVAGGIKVESPKSTNVIIYTLDAIKVYEAEINIGTSFISIPQGAYIITTDENQGKKLIVR